MHLSRFWRLYRGQFKATLLLAWPIIVAHLGQVMMGVVDTAMVGRVGKDDVAAAGVANSVFILISVFGFGLSSAISPLSSIAKAKGKYDETAGILSGAYRAAILVSILITITILVLTYQFQIFKQDVVVEGLAISYLRIVAFSALPMVMFLCVKQFADGLSFTRASMYITLLAIPLNAFVNWLLIYGHWGFPEMGLDGAGFATLSVRIMMLLAMMAFVHRHPKLKVFIEQKPALVGAYFKKVMKVGLPSGLQYFFEIAAFSGAMIIAGWIGTTEQAAHQIAINTAALTYMAASGIAAAGSIRVGSAYGANDIRLARRTGRSNLFLGAVFMAFCGLLLFFFRSPIAAMYIDNETVQKCAESLLVLAALFQLSDGIQAIGLGILRGLTDVRIPTLITLFAYWVIGLPLGYYLGFNRGLGIEGIWIGLLAGLTVSAVLLTWRFNRLSHPKRNI